MDDDRADRIADTTERIEDSLARIETLLDLTVQAIETLAGYAEQTEQNTGATMLHTMPFFSRLRFSWQRAGAVIQRTEDEGKLRDMMQYIAEHPDE
jgi:hypothetical protein